MGWLREALDGLAKDGRAEVRPTGGSMRGRIESGQLVRLERVAPGEVRVDDVVLVRWKGSRILHLVKAVEGGRILIGNALGRINGWADAADVVAKATPVEPDLT